MNSPDSSNNIPNTPTWEKVLGLLGFILLCTGFLYLGWVAIGERQFPPQIHFSVKAVNQLESGYLVEVEVSNSGSHSVESLHLEARLQGQDKESEISTAEIDYVPSSSRKSAGFFFARDPRSGELSLRALGYQKP